MRWYLAAFVICTALELYKNTCDVICKSDGDKLGVVINGECLCSNPRDVDKYVLKLGAVKGKAVTTPTPATIYVY